MLANPHDPANARLLLDSHPGVPAISDICRPLVLSVNVQPHHAVLWRLFNVRVPGRVVIDRFNVGVSPDRRMIVINVPAHRTGFLFIVGNIPATLLF